MNTRQRLLKKESLILMENAHREEAKGIIITAGAVARDDEGRVLLVKHKPERTERNLCFG